MGDPLAADTLVGPLITGLQRGRVEGLIGEATAAGAQIVAGGSRPDIETGFYVAPTLLTEVAPDNPAAQGEFFGPSSWCSPSRTRMRRSPSPTAPNSGSMTTSSPPTPPAAIGWRVSCAPGNVGINTAQRNHEAPFGGFKMSGVGRDGGVFGLHAYSELQSIIWPS